MSFSTLGLIEPLVRRVQDLGYTEPSLIQQQAIPAILEKRDLLAKSQTGTGKTASFVLPLLQQLSEKPRAKNNRAKVLILTPTRELAAQVHESIVKYGRYLSIRSTAVYGGVKINPQLMKLRQGTEILVATPGRLLDVHQQRAVQFDDIDTLVLDEADHMLDIGFLPAIQRIMKLLPFKRQNLLFSATFSSEIRGLVNDILRDPIEIDVTPAHETKVSITQTMHPVDKARKTELLSHLIHQHKWEQALVFSKTKHGANQLVKKLSAAHIHAAAIHGDKTQFQRTKTLNDFKRGDVRILVATDIAARGIDIQNLPYVVNFDLPQAAQDYVHRIGRTGRAGASGQAIALVSADEASQLHAIERLMKQKLDRVEVETFEPLQAVPQASNTAPSKHRGYGGGHKKRTYGGGGNRGNSSTTGAGGGKKPHWIANKAAKKSASGEGRGRRSEARA